MQKEQNHRRYNYKIAFYVKIMHYVALISLFLILQKLVESFVILPNKAGIINNNNIIKQRPSSSSSLFLSTITNSNHNKKKNLPESELINRRKSPVLWRDDHSLDIIQQPSSPSEEINSYKKNQYDYSRLTSPPEVMAPVGGFVQLKAAISNGADSIFLGLSTFSARARAKNFTPKELEEAVNFAHSYDVKVYVTLNTLVFDNEIEEDIIDILNICNDVNIDALIVQDIGIVKLCRLYAPNIEIHASTQQTVCNTDGVLYSHSLGAKRVVLGRELSINEIQQVTTELQQLHDKDVEVETFVHGALCVSYSGQCFSSEAWGGRSANRGQCAQACRLPYGIIQNGDLKDLKDLSYVLSPQDLYGIDYVLELIKAGVRCLKIEGRLKDEYYVAATTRAYRNAIDQAWITILEERYGDANHDAVISYKQNCRSSRLQNDITIDKMDLAQLFARSQNEGNDGLTPGFFEGSKHQRLVIGRSPRHRGVYIGKVERLLSNGQILINIGSSTFTTNGDTTSLLKRGDGIVIDRSQPQEEEIGGPIYDIEYVNDDDHDRSILIRLSKDMEQKCKKYKHMIPIGSYVWRTSDVIVDKKIKKIIDTTTNASLAIKEQQKGQYCKENHLVHISIKGKINEPLQIFIKDTITGNVGIGKSTDVLVEPKQNSIKDYNALSKAVGALGNTNYYLRQDNDNDVDHESSIIDITELDDNVWCPISWVKKARQQAIQHLDSMSNSDNSVKTNDGSATTTTTEHNNNKINKSSDAIIEKLLYNNKNDKEITTQTKTSLSILTRTYEQVKTICKIIKKQSSNHYKRNNSIAISEIIIDFLEVDGMKEAVSYIRQTLEQQGINDSNGNKIKVVIATPRIIKPGEDKIWKILLKLKPDALLIRSSGLVYTMDQLGGTGATISIGNDDDNTVNVTIPELIGDFSLNAINTLTIQELLDNSGLSRITAGYDLNANYITKLSQSLGKEYSQRLDVIIHTHIPIFHTEHCVFARFLSNGDSYLDCGHVCTRNTIHLRDVNQKDNLVLADMGCRNTIFSANAQSGVHSINKWSSKHCNIGTFRIELVDELNDDVEKIIDGYMKVLSRKIKPNVCWDMLKSVRDSNGRCGGVSHGSLRNHSERKAGAV